MKITRDRGKNRGFPPFSREVLDRAGASRPSPLPSTLTFLEHPMAKPTTAKIRLNSESGTGFFYVTKKNTRTMTEKFSIKKYDPVLRKHVEFKEGKIK